MVIKDGICKQRKANPDSVQENPHAEGSLHRNSFDDSILGDCSFGCSERHHTRSSDRQDSARFGRNMVDLHTDSCSEKHDKALVYAGGEMICQ